DHGVETYLIKREEPLRPRRRGPRFSRSRLWSEDERNSASSQLERARRASTATTGSSSSASRPTSTYPIITTTTSSPNHCPVDSNHVRSANHKSQNHCPNAIIRQGQATPTTSVKDSLGSNKSSRSSTPTETDEEVSQKNSEGSRKGSHSSSRNPSSTAVLDEDNVNDWKPEIPFGNLRYYARVWRSAMHYSLALRRETVLNASSVLEMDWEDEAFLEEEIPEDEVTEAEVNQFTSSASNFTHEVDNLMNNNIEIESNKRMRTEHMHPLTLTFKEAEMEEMYHQVRADLLKSNVVCTCVIWVFIAICQSIIIQDAGVLAPTFGPATVVLGAGLLLVMAEEFPSLPVCLRRMSTRLARATLGRKIFICSLIAVIAVPSMLTLLLVETNCRTAGAMTCSSAQNFRRSHTEGNRFPIRLPFSGSPIPHSRYTRTNSNYEDSRSQRAENVNESQSVLEDIAGENYFKNETIFAGGNLELINEGSLENATKDIWKEIGAFSSLKKRNVESFGNITDSSIYTVSFNTERISIVLPEFITQGQNVPANHSTLRTSERITDSRTRYRRHGNKQLIEISTDGNKVQEEVIYSAESDKTVAIDNIVPVEERGDGSDHVNKKMDKMPSEIGSKTINQDTQLNLSQTHSISYMMYCQYPQYWVYTWVLCMVALASFLKLNYLAKTVVLIFMVTCYTILISMNSEIFCSSNK
ncbi:hypothetical protein SK128_011062, partial [Halocaridina rubra]